MSRVAPSRRLLALLYVVGVTILADQVTDVAATVLLQPADAGTAQWRVAGFGIAASRGSVFLIADVLILVAAVGLEHQRILRLLSVIHVVLAAVLAVGLALFGRDAGEVLEMLGPAVRSQFLAATGRTVVVTTAGIGLLGWAGVLGWKASRPSSHRGASEPESLLLPTARETQRVR